jgi:hypothetical protein
MQITTIGLDIAKNVFQVHGIDMTHKRNQVLHATLDVELQARRDRPASLGKQPWDRVFDFTGKWRSGEAAAKLLCWSNTSVWNVVTYPGGMQEHIPGFRSEKKAEEWGGQRTPDLA